ncbi:MULTISPECIES: MazG-like family protein [Acidiplasma]|jgi:NTP pyrophosphatase (non-canonical NTP hydrolase)|uniref:Nucleotide pyrophosphohydrolase n=2 Tax=Acidiplasma TaxID=507753 RepID=A0A0Q0VR73_9ARCH|nr:MULTISPECIES: MazG-like family protein [Acidiplasma]KJE49139.1 hypothetical protein TZ01_03325 [Acidiplasma sp. MBA-1]KPV46866.1 hypothetical protein SE19_03650 [Acidiplasma aeolicum]KQB33651.1 hypothetical protein AOG55_02400 [Acidiplasma cupricumulans]KQB34692.1 hypothetical protein AOG54_03940 [Acidiplasma aeolicum]WMT54928.1 MAG: MazG-like family protein [Acidiplasma sp.]
MATIEGLQKIAREFVEKRDWQKFQTLKDLSMNSAIESSELMEIFLWHDLNFEADIKNGRNPDIMKKIQNEISDIFFTCLAMANELNFNLEDAFLNKMSELDQRYDVEKVRGKIVKIPSPDHKEK